MRKRRGKHHPGDVRGLHTTRPKLPKGQRIGDRATGSTRRRIDLPKIKDKEAAHQAWLQETEGLGVIRSRRR